ncbi:MAG TPA: hypothetical protein EYN67_01960 [Flavobacteriales bacterium]|nr:hypothetical protein [Flavobacteriales bacterium]
MTPNDMIYNEVYKGCLKAGCDELLSKNTAVTTLQKYKNNQFSKPSTLVKESISEAKKLIVKKKKR